MPRMDAAFGWIRKGNEWSGVVPVEAIDSTAVDPRFEVFERRELTLHRWFAARVTSLGTQVADAKSPEEPTHA